MKMPEPTIPPMTSMVASKRPRRRASVAVKRARAPCGGRPCEPTIDDRPPSNKRLAFVAVRRRSFDMDASAVVRREWWTGPGRYLLLSGAIVVLLLQHTWTDAWQGDFWIYVATVGELAANPWHPSHPLFGGDGAFAFVSPYTLALGIAARVTGLPAYEVMLLQ